MLAIGVLVAAFAPSPLVVPQRLLHSPSIPSRSRLPHLSEEVPAVDRVFGTLPYILPVLDGFGYGIYVYQNVPGAGEVAGVIAPLVALFQSLPFAGIVLFIGLSLFTRNAGLSRMVRFNIQQALLLDIALIIPGLFSPVTSLLPLELQIIGTNFVFYVCVFTVIYSAWSNAQGELPDQVPVLSEAAMMQIGPY
uniref:Tic20 family protein Ycf60 n=1 Tax=Coccolithus braarudii TaxID=221442 RepID=A0A7S0PYH6_9EUKA|mmetsp:Transcript_16773/g.36345  ORF Transcript_16773/g.36345 Transcript_16773/m.36345 type:complete len:193 (+) Transcript_16773:32-610(+)